MRGNFQRQIGRESTEHDAMDDAEPSTCERIAMEAQLGDHRHIDYGAVAGFVAARLQDTGEADDESMQFLAG